MMYLIYMHTCIVAHSFDRLYLSSTIFVYQHFDIYRYELNSFGIIVCVKLVVNDFNVDAL